MEHMFFYPLIFPLIFLVSGVTIACQLGKGGLFLLVIITILLCSIPIIWWSRGYSRRRRATPIIGDRLLYPEDWPDLDESLSGYRRANKIRDILLSCYGDYLTQEEITIAIKAFLLKQREFLTNHQIRVTAYNRHLVKDDTDLLSMVTTALQAVEDRGNVYRKYDRKGGREYYKMLRSADKMFIEYMEKAKQKKLVYLKDPLEAEWQKFKGNT